MKLFYLLTSVLLFCCACNTNSEKHNNNNSTDSTSEKSAVVSEKEKLPTDTIISRIVCKTDTSLSFSLYLPASHTSENKLPIIFFFDPHADGILPLKKYVSLARDFGFIMVGSNDSKNGNSYDRSNHILNMLFTDAANRISYDERRLYVAGFSGGARVAGASALSFPFVKGVIACGAGIPDASNAQNKSFAWVGVAGDEDFNVGELTEQDRMLSQTSISHQLIVFNGDHNWCPEEVMKEAWYALLIQTMKQYPSLKNDSLIAKYKNENKVLAMRQEKPVQYQIVKRTIYNLKELSDVSELSQQLSTLERDPLVIKNEQKNRQVQKMESELKQLYLKAFVANDIAWWKRLNETLNKKVSDKDQYKMNKRILSYLSLVAYMNSNAALKQNDTEAAKKFLSIYEIVDPKNAEHAYLTACLYGRSGDKVNAQKYYDKAVKFGFKDVERAKGEQDLLTIKLF